MQNLNSIKKYIFDNIYSYMYRAPAPTTTAAKMETTRCDPKEANALDFHFIVWHLSLAIARHEGINEAIGARYGKPYPNFAGLPLTTQEAIVQAKIVEETQKSADNPDRIIIFNNVINEFYPELRQKDKTKYIAACPELEEISGRVDILSIFAA